MPLGIIWEAALNKRAATGDANDVCARVKATLDAQDARFNANFEAIFKPAAPRHAPAPAPATAASQVSGKCLLSTRRKDGAGRSLLRT
jgi:hypothetical protein